MSSGLRKLVSSYVAVALIAALTVCPPTLPAQELSSLDRSEEAAHDVFNTVMSPFCPGRLLNDCPSASAGELKDKIRSDLRAGKSKEQILENIYSTFGNELRAAPENKGFGTFAWWTPVAFVAVGILVIAAWLKRSQIKSPAGASPHAADPRQDDVSPEMKKRIEDELRRFES